MVLLGCLERAQARSTVVRANARSATRTHTHWFITVQTNVAFICYHKRQTIKQACVVWVNEDDVGLSHVPEQNSMQLVHNAAIAPEMKEDAFKGVFPCTLLRISWAYNFQRLVVLNQFSYNV